MSLRLRIGTAGAAAGLVAIAWVVPAHAATAAPASTRSGTAVPASCKEDETILRTPQQGKVVWIPTTLAAGPYQTGGTESVTIAQGRLHAKTVSVSNSAGGGVGLSIEELVNISGTYDRTWNTTTGVTTSYTQSYTTTSPALPPNVRTRWTLYHEAGSSPVKETTTYLGGCKPTVQWLHGVVLADCNWSNSHLSWEIQYASHPKRLHH